MISFPNCKINLGLYIVDKRADGYHNLETVFYPVKITDALEVVRKTDAQTPTLELSGLTVPGSPEDNLCLKAWHLLKLDFPQLPAVSMHLHKVIPMGAGLGGGSSDGAAALQLLNEKFKLGLGDVELTAYALRLGSDCPFFIYNRPAFAEGRGEMLSPVAPDLSQHTIVIVYPGIHISTALAFSGIQPKPATVNLKEAILQPVAAWKDLIFNVFEPVAFRVYPQLEHIKRWLYQQGAIYASMTGTGAAFYGIFPQGTLLPEAPGSGWQVLSPK